MIRLIPIIFMTLISGCTNNFDKTCNFFVELSNLDSIDEMSASERNAYIMNKVSSLSDGDAKAAWQAINYAVPNKKYMFYQQTAIEAGAGEDWSCPEMKLLAPTMYPETIMSQEALSLESLNVITEKDGDFPPKKSTLPLL